MVDQLSKVLAAKFLSIVGEKFDLTRVRTAAGNIKKVFQLDKLSTQELNDALENSDTAFDKSEELAQKLYNVGSDQYYEEGLYISDNEEKLDSYIQEEKNAKAKMEEYQEYVKHTALECANKLSQLDSMVPKFGTHQNGTEFMEMRSALKKISEMTSGDVSIVDMRKAANELNKKATAYKNSHDSIFKAAPGYGADRFNMSKELINFASYFNDALNEHSKVMTENMKPSDRMSIVDDMPI